MVLMNYVLFEKTRNLRVTSCIGKTITIFFYKYIYNDGEQF